MSDDLHCAACGQRLPPGGAFCNICGAAAPPSLSPPEDAVGAQGGGGSGRQFILVGVAVVCAIAAFVVAGVIFLPDVLDTGPKPPTLTARVANVMGPVVAANDEFRSAIKDIRPNGPNVISQTRQRLRVCDQKGRTLREALRQATATLTAPVGEDAEPETAAETTAKQSLLTAFKANKAFVQSIQRLPADPLRLTQGLVGQCRKAAGETQRAYADATVKFAALQPSYPLPAVSLTSNATARLMLTAGRMAKERAFIAYLGDVNTVLSAARSGRSQASEAVAGTAEDCRMEPDDAGTMMSSAISSRQSSLSAAQHLDPQSNDRARAIQSAMVDSFDYSLRADEQYYLWIQDIGEYYYSPPEGLASRDPRDDFDYYDQAEALSASAGSAKEKLCRLLNRWNEKYDTGDRWSSAEF